MLLTSIRSLDNSWSHRDFLCFVLWDLTPPQVLLWFRSLFGAIQNIHFFCWYSDLSRLRVITAVRHWPGDESRPGVIVRPAGSSYGLRAHVLGCS